jgi:hypothetical protein
MFESPNVKKEREQALAREAHVTKFRDLEAGVEGLNAILAEWEVELGTKRAELGRATDPDMMQKLKDEVSAMVTQMANLTTQRKLKIKQMAEERKRAGLG